MLSPEDAKKELELFRIDGAAQELQKRLRDEPEEIAVIGFAFVQGTLGEFRDANAEAERERFQLKCSIDELDAGAQARLFRTLFPSIAKAVESSWELQRAMPYQSGSLRKAFRSPKSLNDSIRARVGWLDALLRIVLPYRYDLNFLIEWGAHLGWFAEQPIGLLLAGALASGDKQAAETFKSLKSIVNGEQTKIKLGRYTLIALLSSPSSDAWAVVERLLLAAQRQEGLRQVVLEAIDLAHPEAFRRMLRLIEIEKLTRFSAVARAVAVWFGMPLDSSETKLLDHLIRETLENLESPELRQGTLQTATGQTLYLALWATAFNDVIVATRMAETLLDSPEFDRRYPAVHLLTQVGTAESKQVLVKCLANSDLRIALAALRGLPNPAHRRPGQLEGPDIFVALQELLIRTPKDKLLEPAVWSWNQIHAKRTEIAARLICHMGSRPFSELARYIPEMEATERSQLLKVLMKQVNERKAMLREERDIAFSLLGDLSDSVREQAFKLMAHATITAEEALAIELLLSRKASDLRRGVIRLLLKQNAVDCRASIERLATSGDASRIKAAEELSAELEPQQIAAVSLVDGFGLFNPQDRTPVANPRGTLNPQISSDISARLLVSLDALIDAHRETTIMVKTYNDQETQELLGNLRSFRQGPDFPLPDVWSAWWNSQRGEGTESRELARAFCTVSLLSNDRPPDWERKIVCEFVQPIPSKFRVLSMGILWHLLERECNNGDVTFLLDVLETMQHRVSVACKPELEPRTVYTSDSAWRLNITSLLVRFLRASSIATAGEWRRADWRRYWGILRWQDEGMPSKSRRYPMLETTLEAHKQEVATEADVYEQFLGRRELARRNFRDLTVVTKRKQHKLSVDYPWLDQIVQRCRARVLEIELKRGELPTEASAAALSLSSAYGADLELNLMFNLGQTPLERGYIWKSESKAASFSHLLRVCLPAEGDTTQRFAELAAKMGLPKKRLVDLGIYAPQWAPHVEVATGIVGFADAAHWLHAHTKDSQWRVEKEVRELWFAEVSERTPLSREELLDGAVDIEWYNRVRQRISARDWKMILDSAKFASGGNGHKRAELFATAIAGAVKASALAARIVDKRNQDSVRALGLHPLPAAPLKRQREVLGRYQLLAEFLRKSHTFGAQRQASEKLAYSIGLANLARNAGYADPQRFSWAMEARAIADLANGPVEAVEGAAKVTLSINTLGEAELVFEKNGKVLKEIPASLRKSPQVSALRTRKTQLAQQTARMRHSLEGAMIRGDRFSGAELEEMLRHPMLKPMLAALLFVDEAGNVSWQQDLDGQGEGWRIAHPFDLLRSGRWPQFQRACLEAERIQPFKQAFRELYTLTQPERDAKNHSPRYSGQQVNPQGAIAVAGKCGWVNVPEEGLRKTFHERGISAWVTFLEGWFSPVDIDGLTIQHVLFSSRTDGKIIPLEGVEQRIFSEVMRDVDLLVSVAHRGDVDPEATHSTVEMRSALLRETLRMLRIANVRLTQRFAFVDGKIGAYNVHLGSGTVHRQPGGSLCILPVHEQHRGRLFLPFADNDPKTAEIVSKILLLARDDKIKDPTILEQLR